MSDYVHIAKVRDWMNDRGIPRGFEQDTLRRKFGAAHSKSHIFV